ncbi:MAG: TatD family hydrolase [Sedimenticola sp.]
MQATAMQLIDSHCHFDDSSFDDDREAAWRRAKDIGVNIQIVPAIKMAWWPRVKAVCDRYPGLYPAYGLHPMFMQDHEPGHLDALGQWLRQEQPVAIGECGLDFYIPDPDRTGQQRIFEGQLELALEFDLPVVIHARKSVEQVISTLRNYPGVTGMLHSYSGSLQQAEQLIGMGFLLSFGGPATYPGSTRLRKMIGQLPLESILLETDSPDQPDNEHRHQRNEPAYLGNVLGAISGLLAEPPERVAEATTENALRLFRLNP